VSDVAGGAALTGIAGWPMVVPFSLLLAAVPTGS
jgi:hypothetical protein